MEIKINLRKFAKALIYEVNTFELVFVAQIIVFFASLFFQAPLSNMKHPHLIITRETLQL